ncbi:hypothetical protein [Novipirellula sp.]|uniref:hypothetical protein n=1 Tax=Novipirellula sp. TaxID=2795430 RepID=UPI0035678E6F
MQRADVECPNYNILPKRKAGLVKQVVKVVEFPFVFVIVLIVNWKFIINEWNRMPVDAPKLVTRVDVRKGVVTSIQQHTDVVAIVILQRIPPLLDLCAFRG